MYRYALGLVFVLHCASPITAKEPAPTAVAEAPDAGEPDVQLSTGEASATTGAADPDIAQPPGTAKDTESIDATTSAQPSTPRWTATQGTKGQWPYQDVTSAALWVVAPATVAQARPSFSWSGSTPQERVDSAASWRKVELSEAETKTLLKRTRNLKNDNHVYAKCFFPRHAVVFFNAKKEVVGVNVVCFECDGMRLYPSWRGKPLPFGKKARRVHDQALKAIEDVTLAKGFKKKP